jgi:hypothetical protein
VQNVLEKYKNDRDAARWQEQAQLMKAQNAKLQALEYRQIIYEIENRIRGLLEEWMLYHRSLHSEQDKEWFQKLEARLGQLIENEVRSAEKKALSTVEWMYGLKRVRDLRHLGQKLSRGLEEDADRMMGTSRKGSTELGSTGDTDYGGGHGPPWKGRASPLVPAGEAGALPNLAKLAFTRAWSI